MRTLLLTAALMLTTTAWASAGSTPVVVVVTVDDPAAAVSLYGPDRLAGVLDTLTAPYGGARTFVVVDTRSASNVFEIGVAAAGPVRVRTLGVVAATVVDASRGLAPGHAQAQAETIRRRLTAEYGGDVQFVAVSLFPAKPQVGGGGGDPSMLGPDRPPVVAKGDLGPGVGVVFSGLWVLLATLAGLGAVSAAAWVLVAWAVGARRRRRARGAWSPAAVGGGRVGTGASVGGSGATRGLREEARQASQRTDPYGSGDGATAGQPPVMGSPGERPSSDARRDARGASGRSPGDAASGGRPVYSVAAALLLAASAVAQPSVGGAGVDWTHGDVRALDAACRAADFVWVVDVSGSTTAWEDGVRMLAPVVAHYDVTCVAVFGDSTRAVGVGADLASLQQALRDAPTDGHTRVADAFLWAGALARDAREDGRAPQIAVVSDFVDDDASGAVNVDYLPTLAPPAAVVDTSSGRATPVVGESWYSGWLRALAALGLAGLAWVLGRGSRRRTDSVVVEVDGQAVQVYRDAEPVRVRPSLGAAPLPLVVLAFNARGVVTLTLDTDTESVTTGGELDLHDRLAARPVF